MAYEKMREDKAIDRRTNTRRGILAKFVKTLTKFNKTTTT